MSALDSWVTEYEGKSCGCPAYHIYRCVRDTEFEEDLMGVGCIIPVDHQNYEVCGIDTACPSEEESWVLIYAHLVPDSMNESDWHGLYGDPELACTG